MEGMRSTLIFINGYTGDTTQLLVTKNINGASTP